MEWRRPTWWPRWRTPATGRDGVCGLARGAGGVRRRARAVGDDAGRRRPRGVLRAAGRAPVVQLHRLAERGGRLPAGRARAPVGARGPAAGARVGRGWRRRGADVKLEGQGHWEDAVLV